MNGTTFNLENPPLGGASLACRAMMQNGFVESFNGSFRDECLNETLFTTLEEGRTKINEWKEDYNHNRPHSSLGNLTPYEYVMKINLQNMAA